MVMQKNINHLLTIGDHSTKPLPKPTLREKILGFLSITKYIFSGIAHIAPDLFRSRNPEARRRTYEAARQAENSVLTTPIREVENSIGINEYAYPRVDNGYSTHSRYRRPKSRSDELQQFASAEKSIEKRLASTPTIVYDSSKEESHDRGS